jgi:hypothetical protein
VLKFDKFVPSSLSPAMQQMQFQRDWAIEFVDALRLPDSKAKFETLRNLELDFVYAAQLYGKIIISELSLPVQRKTIKPVSVGGIAGGEKYVCQNILFKFAVDIEGLYKSDENAMKAASHDLKGLMAFFATNIADLHVPLMATIDYKGFRLQALSMLPVSRSTLAYGSCDGARTVHTDNERLNKLMQEAGALLNLKPHCVGPHETLVHAVADIEGHVGNDGRFWLLDFARVAPPQPVTRADPSGAMLYRLMRLELVKRWVRPLSADAFSNMGRHNAREHNSEVTEAFGVLMNEVVPSFAVTWSASLRALVDKGRATDLDSVSILDDLVLQLHARGINVRHLGAVRAATDDDGARALILTEAMARVAKNSLRALLRRDARRSGVPCRERFSALALAFLNLCLRPLGDARATQFWDDVEMQAEHKFKLLFLRRDKTLPFEPARAQVARVPHQLLFRRILQLLCVELDARAMLEFVVAIGGATLGDSAGFELVQPDLVELHTRTKHIGLVAYADAMQLYYSAIEAPEGSDTKMRLLVVAREKLEAARLVMVLDAMATFHLARTFQLMAENTPPTCTRRCAPSASSRR